MAHYWTINSFVVFENILEGLKRLRGPFSLILSVQAFKVEKSLTLFQMAKLKPTNRTF